MQASLAVFERVYRKELPFVWAAARRLGVHPAVIDDAVQDVFLTAYRRWDDLHRDASLRAWLYGVTRRVAFRYRRSHARTARRKDAVARSGGAGPVVPHREREEAHDVDAVLAELEPGRREVFVMSELLDMSGPEIAAQLEIPLNTVYSRLRLARRELEPRLRRGVEAFTRRERKRDQPPPGQAQRTWVVLAARLGAPVGAAAAPGALGTIGTIGAWTGGRAIVVALVVGVWTAAAIGAPRRDRPRDREARAVEAAAPVEPSRAHAGASASASTEPSLEPPRAATRGPAAPVSPRPPVEGDASRRASVAPSARSPGSPPSGAVASTPTEPPEPGLEDEVAVLDRASAALHGGDAVHALQWLAEHARRFPSGRLADVRKATRVRALCRLGRDAQARTEALALRREHPGSAVARRTSIDCDRS